MREYTPEEHAILDRLRGKQAICISIVGGRWIVATSDGGIIFNSELPKVGYVEIEMPEPAKLKQRRPYTRKPKEVK